MFVRVKRGCTGFLVGSRYYTPDDGVFELEDQKATAICKLGFAEPCAALPTETTQRAVDRKPEAAKR